MRKNLKNPKKSKNYKIIKKKIKNKKKIVYKANKQYATTDHATK